MKTNYKKALSYLSKDEFRHAGMLEVIKRGSAKRNGDISIITD